MDKIMAIASKYKLLVIEDAAQAIDSFYKGRPLGSIGHLSAFSFHETKNIISGEGGMLCINSFEFIERAEILWEKGTNRASFFRGEINKYGWVDTGSSFLPSEIIAAFLYAQLENMEAIQKRRLEIWEKYYDALLPLANEYKFSLPNIPDYATNNAHMFYVVCNSLSDRTKLISGLKQNNILAVFHYISLHSSEFYKDKYIGNPLVESDRYTDCLVRLPMYFELSNNEINRITQAIKVNV
jgi:dTDP-4-amino-4,6-dideoxygalactose transaminase